MKKVLVFAAGALVLGLTKGAAADESRELAAESRFVEGLRLLKDGNCTEALVRLRESQELSPASGTLLDIGYCESNLGHLSRAWLAYRRALSLAESSAKPAHVEMAKREADQLEPKLGWLSVRLSNGAQWRLFLDSEPLASDFRITDFPVDPGKHTFSASSAGREVLRRSIDVKPGQHTVIEIDAPPPEAKSKNTQSVPKSEVQVKPPNATAANHEPSTLPLYALITGGALFTGGVIVFAHARYSYDAANCPNNICTGDARSQRLAARNEAFVSYALAASGAVLTATGIYLHFSNARKHENGPTVSLETNAAGCMLQLKSDF